MHVFAQHYNVMVKESRLGCQTTLEPHLDFTNIFVNHMVHNKERVKVDWTTDLL